MNYDEKVAWAESEKRNKERAHNAPYIPRPNEPLSHMGFPGGQAVERAQGIKIHPSYYDLDYAEQLQKMKAMLSEYVQELPGTFGEF